MVGHEFVGEVLEVGSVSDETTPAASGSYNGRCRFTFRPGSPPAPCLLLSCVGVLRQQASRGYNEMNPRAGWTDRKPRLDGKVAIVTGAGSKGSGIGIGRATALLLAAEGARVALVDVDLGSAAGTLEMIDAGGGRAIVVEGDVTVAASCESAVTAAVREWNRLDLLINNVGINGPNLNAVDVEVDDWQRTILVNLTSVILMSRYAIPEMRRQGAGSIVNIASIADWQEVIPEWLIQHPRAVW